VPLLDFQHHMHSQSHSQHHVCNTACLPITCNITCSPIACDIMCSPITCNITCSPITCNITCSHMLPLSLIFIAAQGVPGSRTDLELYGIALLQELITVTPCGFYYLHICFIVKPQQHKFTSLSTQESSLYSTC